VSSSSSADLVPLDAWDELFHSLYEGFQGAGTGTAVLKLRGRVEPEPLTAALLSLQKRHPKLRARIVGSSDGRHAFQVAATPPPIPVEFKDFDADELPWKEESTRLMNAELDPSVDSLARVVVLRGRARDRSVVLVLIHHALGDGLSGMSLVDDLLGYYSEAEGRTLAPPASLRIPISPRAKLPGNLLKRLVMMVRIYRHRRENRRGDWTWLPRGGSVPPDRLWEHFVFSERDTKALAARCRTEKTTLYGALFAAAARGLMVSLQQPNVRFKCRVPIDVRDKLTTPSGPVTKNELGNYIAGYESIYRLDDRSDFWALARQAHRDVKRFTAAGGPSFVYNFIRLVKLPYVPQTLRRGTMFVTSYGVAGLRDRYGSLSLEEVAIGFRSDNVGPSLLIQGLVIQKRLNVNLSMVDVPEDFWSRAHAEIRRELEQSVQLTSARAAR
jgi:hypothetical protein